MALSAKVQTMVNNFGASQGVQFAATFVQLNPSPEQIAFMVAHIQPMIDAANAAIAGMDTVLAAEKVTRVAALNAQLADLNQAVTEIQALGS